MSVVDGGLGLGLGFGTGSGAARGGTGGDSEPEEEDPRRVAISSIVALSRFTSTSSAVFFLAASASAFFARVSSFLAFASAASSFCLAIFRASFARFLSASRSSLSRAAISLYRVAAAVVASPFSTARASASVSCAHRDTAAPSTSSRRLARTLDCFAARSPAFAAPRSAAWSAAAVVATARSSRRSARLICSAISPPRSHSLVAASAASAMARALTASRSASSSALTASRIRRRSSAPPRMFSTGLGTLAAASMANFASTPSNPPTGSTRAGSGVDADTDASAWVANLLASALRSAFSEWILSASR
mmetsp:Transcript_4061/g.18175  ORF Transcript_4061/g.18175 Transcript_4061/m.18175 type:complete len:307 (+) Transcript_4061:1837-2757(+)